MQKKWKKTNIAPIFKKSDEENALVERHVSLRVMVCKIMGKIKRKEMDKVL